ncbi:MAG: hypothetical protein IJS52_00335 [Bacilli bacterium]|nr:hypothetical protein [Bacilli bacterium]
MAQNETPQAPFPKARVYRAFGALIALFGILLLLSPCTRIRHVGFPIHFLFGTAGFYLCALLAIEGGLHLIFHAVWKRYRVKMWLGLMLGMIGIYVLLVALAGNAIDPSHYNDALMAAYQGNGQALYGFGSLAGGYLGNALAFPLQGQGLSWVLYLVAALFLLLCLVLCLFPVWVRLFHGLRSEVAIAKSRKEKKKSEREDQESSYVIESEEPYAYASQDPFQERTAPTLGFARKEEKAVEKKPEEPMPENPLSGYVFAPAGGSTLPSRRSVRTQRAVSSAKVQGDPTPYVPPMSPREVASPAPVGYTKNPIRTSGLQEAVFIPSDELAAQEATPSFDRPATLPTKQEAPRETTPVRDEPAVMATPAPKAAEPIPFTPKETEPIEEEKPLFQARPSFLDEPEKKEEPVVPTPNPVILHEPKAADTIEVVSEEEEDEYVMPSNDPIVLAPNPTAILTGETLAPEEKVEEAVAEESKPAVDDDLEGPLPPYVFPTEKLLDEGTNNQDKERIEEECRQKAATIDQIFADFGVGAHVTEFLVGPSITRYSITTDPGVSVQSVGRYIQDLEVRLGGVPVRFVERVLGMACSALEVANDTRRIVPFKEVFTGLPKRKETADLHIPFGIDISGALKEADLSKFPHMLVAGTSGSGKSIFAHGILLSLVMRNRPEDLKLVLIDPKRGVEMAPYKDMPHLLCPIVKEAKPARNALKKLCELMDKRYEMFGEAAVRDIGGYNKEYALPQGKKRMPYIVVFIDEFADLVGECKEISEYVLRIAQKARACGIHLIVATQRPDVKVITGTIKSNLLCRVALTVASSTDSQTILGVGGAEDLYGYGDMLIDCQELSKRDFTRAQGCLATGHEMKAVCDFVRAQMKPSYDPEFLHLEDEEEESGPEIRDGGYAPVAPTMSSQELRKISDEEKYQYVKSVIMTREYCSISMIQREFEVGFPRAGKILAKLQAEGIVASPGDAPNNSKGCRVLVHEDPNGGNPIA